MTGTFRVAAILCALLGTTYADHYHGDRGHGPVIRDHRGGGPVIAHGGGGPVVRDHRGPERRGPVVTHVRVSGGRYVFPGGVVRTYRRPVIHEHYRDRHRRPALIVETYDPVPGYVWVGGGWSWSGYEWMWTPGYWSAAVEPAPAPVMGGGISVSAGISIH